MAFHLQTCSHHIVLCCAQLWSLMLKNYEVKLLQMTGEHSFY